MKEAKGHQAGTQGSAIVAGYGPAGRIVGEHLEASGYAVTVVDTNPDTVLMRLERNKGAKFGNILDEGVLRNAGIMEADVLVIAIPDEGDAIEACRIARKMRGDLKIVARTNFLSRGLMAGEAGANEVVVEEVVTAEAMRDAVNRLMDRA
ncbi:NAD-binding protein [Poriferisphaera corsica]|uniref:NAD-binding protein n=1 Tax=Poriferisphaera corsica TaxID=2528020 RepID=UPI00190AA77A|nr:NAD(P)-binding protein [Poriferisphaera corsica]